MFERLLSEQLFVLAAVFLCDFSETMKGDGRT